MSLICSSPNFTPLSSTTIINKSQVIFITKYIKEVSSGLDLLRSQTTIICHQVTTSPLGGLDKVWPGIFSEVDCDFLRHRSIQFGSRCDFEA